MEIVELRNIVRAMRADKVALDYMDEVLTAVDASKETLAATKQEIANTQAILERLTKERATKEADAAIAVKAEQDRTALMLADRTERLGELDAQIRVREDALANWQARLTAIEQEHQRRVEDLTSIIAALTAERAAVAQELERTKQGLATLRASLGSLA